MSDVASKRVTVIGAGLCGLMAACRLHQRGYNVTVLEKAPVAGGVIQSLRQEGYLLEAGPNTFPSTGKAITGLCRELSLAPQATDTRTAKKRYLYYHQRLTPLPDTPWRFLLSPLLSPGAKLRLLQEPWQPQSQGEPTMAEFVRRRLGPEILARFVDPFVSGVYAGNPETLSMPAVFPRLMDWERESGSLLRRAWQARKATRQNRSQQGDTPYELLGLPDGTAALPQALAKRLPDDAIRLSTAVESLEETPNGGYRLRLADGDTLDTEAVVIATPADTASNLLKHLAPTAAAALEGIPYVPMSVVHFGFPQSDIPHPLDGFGFLCPRSEGLRLLGAVWSGSLFPQRAPAGHTLLTCFIGGAHQPEVGHWSPEQTRQQVLDDLRRVFRQPDLTPTFSHVTQWPQAIPQYTLGHQERVQTARQALERLPGIVLSGNYLQGVSLNDCVLSGEAAAAGI